MSSNIDIKYISIIINANASIQGDCPTVTATFEHLDKNPLDPALGPSSGIGMGVQRHILDVAPGIVHAAHREMERIKSLERDRRIRWSTHTEVYINDQNFVFVLERRKEINLPSGKSNGKMCMEKSRKHPGCVCGQRRQGRGGVMGYTCCGGAHCRFHDSGIAGTTSDTSSCNRSPSPTPPGPGMDSDNMAADTELRPKIKLEDRDHAVRERKRLRVGGDGAHIKVEETSRVEMNRFDSNFAAFLDDVSDDDAHDGMFRKYST